MKHTTALITLLILSLTSSVTSANTSTGTSQFKTVGKAEMRWLLFPLYQIELKTPDGRYQANRYPQVLDIMYRRTIEKQHLLTATNQQWQRLGLPQAKREQWIAQLNKVWPSVKAGDTLSFQLNADGKNTFVHNGRNIGGVSDTQFGESFLAIWLSPKTSQPGIRQRLIGPNS